MLEAILIIMCFISGFLTSELWKSVKDRKNENPIDAEYSDGKFRIVEK